MSERNSAPPRPAKVAIASMIGTTIEWYDFFLFGTAATLIFNKQFFPSLSPLVGTLAAFATFGVAFVARPIGGIVFGHFGDRIGRKRMLVLSLILMGGATIAIGLLPTYAQIGVFAPILLVITRLLQGLAVGGEWGGAVLMAVEHAPPGKKALYGSAPQAGVPAGLILSLSAFLLVQQLPEEDILAWGWRLPFLASVVLLGVGVYIRRRIAESPDFEKAQKEDRHKGLPLFDLLRSAPRPLLVGILTQVGANVPFWVATVFMLSYGPDEIGVSRGTIMGGLLIACLVDLAAMPICSVLADRYGRRNLLLAGAVYMGLAAFPFFALFNTGTFLGVTAAMVLIIGIGHAVTYAAVAAFLAELFETRYRYTGVSLAYQLGGIISSGPTPFVAAALFAAFGTSSVIALLIAGATVVTIIGLLFTPRSVAAVRSHTDTSVASEAPAEKTPDRV